MSTIGRRRGVTIYLNRVFRYAGLSKGYIGTATSWTEPDLTTIDGWPAATYQLPDAGGHDAGCGVEVLDSAAGPSEFATKQHADGVVIRSAEANRNFMP